ncbi:hypothetical protein GGC03_04250 [Vibrio sp. THAF191c]|nr:hypothetical protein FIU99_04250 [Vibrio sp. THAF64]QGM33527.1 hypothetical protein GGC04_04255 [Vibrio sp. THAF191d]QGN69029.1 hypothetical protein GGC03_04250 [Vibrio sp. THAF191c]
MASILFDKKIKATKQLGDVTFAQKLFMQDISIQQYKLNLYLKFLHQSQSDCGIQVGFAPMLI